MPDPHCLTMTMDERKGRVAELVERFERALAHYPSKDYNKINVRLEFIDPFLECLGWDVKNETGKTAPFRSAQLETPPKFGYSPKRPDYVLCLGNGEVVLFVETKHLSADLECDSAPALRVRRYGYSAKLKWSLLTNFEECVVFDTTIKPKNSDKSSVARVAHYTFRDYVEKFDELYNIFSYKACDSGRTTYYAETKVKKGTANVEDDILELIEGWRLDLAKEIAKHGDIDAQELTAVVQKIIDRILFLRIWEEKKLESYGSLQRAAKEKDAWAAMKELFREADKNFNSGLFAHDKVLDGVTIDTQCIRSMIKGLYFPECPYEFSVLPVEILGTIYERFLGEVISFRHKNAVSGYSIQVIQKPEVQKTGGVFYTPAYIVDYIVEQTIGKLIAGKTPEQIAKMHFVDPACGSGSFLVGAYRYLLRYYTDWYMHPDQCEQAIKHGIVYKDTETKTHKLSLATKRKILTTHIYGVDLDPQAVEVARMSLFLKMLEDEGPQTVNLVRATSLNGILPKLNHNIVCGNSLVAPDYDGFFEYKEEFLKIHPFDWHKTFAAIFKQGGFDAVIGNPPYVFARDSKDKGFKNDIKEYYYKHYDVAQYQINLYHLFIEQACKVLKPEGAFSFIIPNNWLTINSNKDLREYILKKSNIKIVNFLFKVFHNAEVDTCILYFENSDKNNTIELLESSEPKKIERIAQIDRQFFLNQNDLIINLNLYKNDSIAKLLEKMENASQKLEAFAKVKSGIKAYEVGKGTPKQTDKMKADRIYHSKVKENEHWYPYIEGNDVNRYALTWKKQHYLKYGVNLAAHRTFDLFSKPRILVRQIPSKPPYCILACYTDLIIINDLNSMNIVYFSCQPLFLLGILNSRANSFWFVHKFGKMQRKLFPQFKINELKTFPIPLATEKQQNEMVAFVEKMLIAQQKLLCAKTPSDRDSLNQQVETLDRKINALVYALYSLTAEEIEMVECS